MQAIIIVNSSGYWIINSYNQQSHCHQPESSRAISQFYLLYLMGTSTYLLPWLGNTEQDTKQSTFTSHRKRVIIFLINFLNQSSMNMYPKEKGTV